MSNTGMMQRCWEHDYCEPCFYMITIVTEPRRDCLGALHVQTGGQATVTLSAIGETVRDVWRRTSSIYPGVEACECVLMPAPFPYQRQHQAITREQCLELNAWAQVIAEAP